MIPAALAVLALDQLTKEWALSRLVAMNCDSGSFACTDLFLGVRLRLVFNEGAAFSTGANFGPLFGVLAFIIVGILIFIGTKRESLRTQIILGVLAGGALGNLADRIFRAQEGWLSGAVVDFIDLGWWPVFNIADVCIVCGAIALAFFLDHDKAVAADVLELDSEPEESMSHD